MIFGLPDDACNLDEIHNIDPNNPSHIKIEDIVSIIMMLQRHVRGLKLIL